MFENILLNLTLKLVLQLLPIIIVVVIAGLKKTILKSVNPAYYPILLGILGLVVGSINCIAGQSCDAVDVSTWTEEAWQSFLVPMSAVGIHQLVSQYQKIKGAK